MKRAVVTGATGMIGAALVEYLVGQGVEVLAICRPESKRKDHIVEHPNVKIYDVALEELYKMEHLHTYDVFFHLAWSGTDANSRSDVEVQNKNVQYTLDAVKLAKGMNCHTFVGGGSQAEYGRSESRLSDSTPICPETAYGIAKYTAGKLSGLLAQQLGLRHIWARILSAYGPRDGKTTMIMSTIYKILSGEVPKLTKGEQLWDYVYVADVVRALYLLAVKGKSMNTYCIGSGQAVPLKEYFFEIKEAVNPGMTVDIGARPYAPDQVMYLCADLSKLTRDTGFTPEIGFREGIRRTVVYCKEIRGSGTND